MNKHEHIAEIIIKHLARMAKIANVSIITAHQCPRMPGTRVTNKNDQNIWIVDYADTLKGLGIVTQWKRASLLN